MTTIVQRRSPDPGEASWFFRLWLGHRPLHRQGTQGARFGVARSGPNGAANQSPGSRSAPRVSRRPSIRSLTQRNPNGVADQSPGSRSAPWVGTEDAPSSPCPSVTPTGFHNTVHVGAARATRCGTLAGFGRVGLGGYLTQGALRDPGLCWGTFSGFGSGVGVSSPLRPAAY
jgi:hypothetical protein